MTAGGGGGGGAVYSNGGTYYNGVNGYDAGFGGEDGVKTSGNSLYDGQSGAASTTRALAGQNYIAESINSNGITFIDEEDIPNFIDVSYTPLANPTGGGAVQITKLGIKRGFKLGDETGILETSTDVTNKIAELKNSLVSSDKAFILKESFSPYFYVYDNGSGTENDGEVSFELDANLIESTESVSGFKPYGNLSYTTTGTTYSYNFTSNSSKTVKLKPIDGFLGGNDVPLLISADISHNGHTTSTSDDTKAIPALDYTDYANVSLASEALNDTISTEPVFIDYNSTLTEAMLSANVAGYPYGTDKGLCDDYADYSPVAYDEKVGQTITEDTETFVIAELAADAPATKANVIGEVDKVSRNFRVPVYVRYPIETDLTHLTSDAAEEFPTTVDDNELVFELTVDNGYDLPAEKDVLITNTDLTDPNAEPTVIENAVVEKIDDKIRVSIPRKSITGKVTVTAAGVHVEHSVKYYYEMFDPVSKVISLEEAVDSKTFANGDVISGLSYPTIPDEFPNGYDGYFWDWSITPDENSGDYIMGQEDVIIVGTYKPITYGITVKYYTKESEDAVPQLWSTYRSPLDRTQYDNDTYKIALTKGAEFYIASPEIEGYVTNTPYISGKVDDAFIASLDETVYDGDGHEHPSKTVNVYYTKVSEDTELIVNFIKCDVRGAPLGTISVINPITRSSGYDYSNISDEISVTLAGFDRVKITKVSGDAAETKVDSITEAGTYNVYYRDMPQKVTINLYKNIGDSQPVATRTAVVGREYSYDADKDDFIPLPSTVDSSHEYRHTGWKTASGDIVEDDMIVTGSNEGKIDLYAGWESSKITITVKYLYAWNVQENSLRGTEAAADYPYVTDYGKSYTIISPELTNYTAEPSVVTGVALANKEETVYYKDNASSSITITANIYSIYYQDSDSGNAAEGAPLLKGGTFSLYDQNGTLIGTKQNTSGVVSWDNTEFDIRHGMTYTIKCTDPPLGYGDGKAEVTVGNSDEPIVIDNIEIFLDVTPFELPYAGSTPMTGYTVFGSSTMLLAVFLLFVHMRSKTEEEKFKETK
jgi:hypothetical protein